MGGNGSYDKGYGGVPPEKRTHDEVAGHTILGHKILVPSGSPTRASAPMNCNTPKQVYVIASAPDKRSGDKASELSVSSVAFYEGNHISYSVDVKYTNGKVSAFKVNTGENTTHAHEWQEIKPGIWGRKSHDKNNHLAPDSRWNSNMVKAIESFNSKRITWNK